MNKQCCRNQLPSDEKQCCRNQLPNDELKGQVLGREFFIIILVVVRSRSKRILSLAPSLLIYKIVVPSVSGNMTHISGNMAHFVIGRNSKPQCFLIHYVTALWILYIRIEARRMTIIILFLIVYTRVVGHIFNI